MVVACTLGLWRYTAHNLDQGQVNKAQEECAPCASHTDGTKNVPPPESDFIDEALGIKRGDNFTSVLYAANISKHQTLSLINALKKTFNPRDLRTDHKIFITYKHPKSNGDIKDLKRLVIRLSLEKEVIVEQDDAGLYQARLESKDLIHKYRHAEGQIENSLYVDAVKQGAHPKIIHNMIQAFSYDVDFQRSFRSGDAYCLLFDYHKDPHSLQEKAGDLLYASLTLHGKPLHIYRHKNKNGHYQYVNEKGHAVKKGLLRTPVDGARISGTFGYRKKHPVLGYGRMHKGVDFAAPRNTPIMAAGAGKVVRIGRLGGYGNYIKIKHNTKYSTAYAHMCRYAKGLKIGSAVRQGQVIGYVGCTGTATGNHLHYELLAHGKQINPKHVKMIPSGKLQGKELQRFMANKENIHKRLEILRNPVEIAEGQTDMVLAAPPSHPFTNPLTKIS